LKKAFVAILAILYMTIASGVEMNIHYCMGEFASMELGKAADEDCSRCGMKAKAGCCEDESRIVKLEDSHQASFLSWSVLPPMVVPSTYFEVGTSKAIAVTDVLLPPSHAPPGSYDIPVYLRNCVFRI
jgi:hypothetical protein